MRRGGWQWSKLSDLDADPAAAVGLMAYSDSQRRRLDSAFRLDTLYDGHREVPMLGLQHR